MDIENVVQIDVEPSADTSGEITFDVEKVGPQGLSAYDVAVKDGFEGSEQEWLVSLKGDIGETPEIAIGTTQTLPAGSSAVVTKAGTTENPIFSFGIPRGAQGVVGATPNLQVGSVTSGNESEVTITGTTEEPILNFVLEKGATGQTGPAGADGQDGISPTASVSKSGSVATITITDKEGTTTATINDGTNGTDGQDGVGVPSGGTTGQILAKTNDTDYATQWINAPNQGGSDTTTYVVDLRTNAYYYTDASRGFNNSDTLNELKTALNKMISGGSVHRQTDNICTINSTNQNYSKVLTFYPFWGNTLQDAILKTNSLTQTIQYVCKLYPEQKEVDGKAFDNFLMTINLTFNSNRTEVSTINSFAIAMTWHVLTTTTDVLTKTNTTSYTPTASTHPATKGYVDDSITSAIGSINTVLATLTTPSNGGE